VGSVASMTDDTPFYAWNSPPAAPRQRQPGEPLFEFQQGHDRWRCELRDHRTYGVEAQFLKNEEFSHSRRFPRRELAIEWATEERQTIEKS
jgi:hypothetical protein